MHGQVVWITGASSGIGEALAYACARRGARLVLSARRLEELERVKVACGLPDEQVLVLPLDLGSGEEFAAQATLVTQYFGRIDVLIHSGGVSQRSYFQDTAPEVFRRIMETNFFGTVALTRQVLPQMVRQSAGSIVVISSVVGKYGTPLRSAYTASKHALHGFFDALRAEHWRDNLHVLLVCPGYIRTNISLNAFTGTGSPQGIMDEGQRTGMAPDTCAERIIAALTARKSEVYIGGFKEVFAVYLKRWLPALMEKVVRKVNVT